MGNGLIIATLGHGGLASTLQGIRLTNQSPSQTECNLALAIDGVMVRLPRQSLRRVRGASFVLSQDQGRDLSLLTLNYAKPGSERITRCILVRNTSDRNLTGLTLSARLEPARDMSLTMSGARGQGGSVCSHAFELAPGASREFLLGLGKPAAAPGLPQNFDEAIASAIATWEWWRSKLSDTTSYDSDRAKLRDLIEDWKVNLLLLRDARSGAIEASGSGALLLLLRFRLWDEARQLLEHGMKAGPVPGWSLLEHYWYWRATKDRPLIAQHWDALQAGLEKDAGRPPARTLRQATLDLLAHHCAGLLAGMLGRSDAESAFLTRSREIMARSEDLFWLETEGRFAPEIDAQGAPLRTPQAEQNYFPLWAGWTYASGMRSRRNLASSLASLWVGPRRSGSRADSGPGGGEIPGMLLAALTEQGQAERIEVIEELMAMAEPAGEWSASHDASGRPIRARSGCLDPTVAGINLDAMLFAITGMRCAAIPGFAERNLSLHLAMPLGSNYFTVKGAAQDGRVINLYMRRTGTESQPDSGLEFDLVLVSNRAEPGAAIPVSIRSMGDTHLGWLWDAADRVGANGGWVTPRRISASSRWQAPTETLLPRAYLR